MPLEQHSPGLGAHAGQLTAELRHDAVKHAAEHERHGDAAVVLGLIDARDARDAFRLNVGRPVKLKFPIG